MGPDPGALLGEDIPADRKAILERCEDAYSELSIPLSSLIFSISLISLDFDESVTDRPTDGRTDGRSLI